MVREGRLSGRLGTEYLGDPASRDSAHAQSHVQRDRAGGDRFHAGIASELPQPHHGTLAEVPVDLPDGQFQGFCFLVRHLIHRME